MAGLSFRPATGILQPTSGSPILQLATIAPGDYAIATVFASSVSAAHSITAVSSFIDSQGNTWNQLVAPVQTASVGGNVGSLFAYGSRITNGAGPVDWSITPTFTYGGAAGNIGLIVDVITGFQGLATLDPGGVAIENTGTAGLTALIPVLNSGTGKSPIEACYTAAVALAGQGASGGATTTGLSGGSVYTGPYESSAPSIAAFGYVPTNAAPSSSDSITAHWGTSREWVGYGLSVYQPSIGDMMAFC